MKDTNTPISKKESLTDKIKDFYGTALVVTVLGLAGYSSWIMFYNKFTADYHKQIRTGNIIEEIYGFDRNKNGSINEIKIYAESATPRGLIILPLMYDSSDSQFNDKLKLLKDEDTNLQTP